MPTAEGLLCLECAAFTKQRCAVSTVLLVPTQGGAGGHTQPPSLQTADRARCTVVWRRSGLRPALEGGCTAAKALQTGTLARPRHTSLGQPARGRGVLSGADLEHTFQMLESICQRCDRGVEAIFNPTRFWQGVRFQCLHRDRRRGGGASAPQACGVFAAFDSRQLPHGRHSQHKQGSFPSPAASLRPAGFIYY